MRGGTMSILSTNTCRTGHKLSALHVCAGWMKTQKTVLGRKNQLRQGWRVENSWCIQEIDSHPGDPVIIRGSGDNNSSKGWAWGKGSEQTRQCHVSLMKKYGLYHKDNVYFWRTLIGKQDDHICITCTRVKKMFRKNQDWKWKKWLKMCI